MSKKIMLIVVMLYCITTTLISITVYADQVDTILVSNEYVEFSVENGKFTIGTTGGNPDIDTDNNQKLLFGHPNPWSSFSTIRVDDIDYVFNSSELEVDNINNPTIGVAEMNLENNIIVCQELSIIQNTHTGFNDTVQIKYIIENSDEEIHNIGLRIMLDTMLGSNDGAPFRVPGYGNITTELELTGDDIPAFWQAFDNLEQPNVFSTGTFYRDVSEAPDKVAFAYWDGVHNTLWEYETTPDKPITGDSAIAMYWTPITVSPGEKIEFTTFYGIGSFLQQDLRPPLTLSVYTPKELDVSSDGSCYIPNPFTITAYVGNTSGVTALDSSVSLVLPDDLVLISNNEQVLLGDIQDGQDKMVSWQVRANSVFSDRDINYSIIVTSENSDPKTLSLSINLPAITIIEENRKIGIEFEQITDIVITGVAPVINTTQVELIADNSGQYKLTILDFDCDITATPFFFWKADEGIFVNPSDDYMQVEFIADEGTFGRKIPVYAYIGDGQGRIGCLKIWVNGR